MRIAMTTNEVSAFIKDTDFSNHEIIGDSVSCNRMMIDLYKPIIRSFMVLTILYYFLVRDILAIAGQRCIFYFRNLPCKVCAEVHY